MDSPYVARMPPPGDLHDLLVPGAIDRLLTMARTRAIVDAELELVARPDVDAEATRAVLAEAQEAARLVARDGADATLTPAQREAIELFLLLTSRPALFVLDDRVYDRPQNWPQLTQDSAMVESRVHGVGRIEVAPFGQRCAMGTGFVAGDRRVLTNNHVVVGLLGEADGNRWRTDPEWFATEIAAANRAWPDGVAPRFELVGELGSSVSRSTSVVRVLGHHPEVDVAVLELAAMPAGAKVLRLATAEPADLVGQPVYVLGYPVRDHPGRTAVVRRIFGSDEAQGVKRCSPGRIMGLDGPGEISHDASTLPGSSGSAVIDFRTHEVIAIHFAGQFEERNRAVPLWPLRGHPILAAPPTT